MTKNRLATISFYDTVDGSSSKTLVSKRITSPFIVKTVRAHFALNTNRLLKLRFFISPDDATPTSQPVTGTNILAQLGQVDYLVGDDEYKEIHPEVRQATAGAYIKVFAENTDVSEHTIDAQVEIETIDEEK